MVIAIANNVEYDYIPDGTVLEHGEAAHYLMNAAGPCTVLKHQATVDVRYLVEFPNGERRWVSEDNPA
jgi:hypothetical protein